MKHNNLRDQMLELEPYPEDLKMNIRNEIELTTGRPIKIWERGLLLIGCVFVVLVVAFITALCVSEAERLHAMMGYRYWSTRVSLVFGAVMVTGYFVFVFVTLKRGTIRYRHNFNLGWVVFVFLAANTAAEMMFTRSGPNNGLLGALIISVAVVLLVSIEAAEKRLRERTLRNELALAELTELVTMRALRENGEG